MRTKRDTQGWLDYQDSNLQLTNDYFRKYEAIAQLLDDTPTLLELIHRDLEKALEQENGEARRCGGFCYTSEMLLRLELCRIIEGDSLRGIVVRVDDSRRLRCFTRIYDGPMMGHTTLCELRNAIQPETWKDLNHVLGKAAVERELITGEKLRLDTTAVETNIHHPTDSSLLWDCYRTLGRLIEVARDMNADAVGTKRVHLKRAKKLATKIARNGRSRGRKTKEQRAKELKPLYKRLIAEVERILEWSVEIADHLDRRRKAPRHAGLEQFFAESLIEELRDVEALTKRVLWQAIERTIDGRQVPNEKKLFSIFEPHTELLIRGKAGKDIEYGHMIQIQQVGEKFITDYEVFEKKPAEPALVRPALASHEALFGDLPLCIAADKGYWSKRELAEVFDKIEVVSIPKKGRRNDAEREREHDPLFRHGQMFRAGVEGSISFLKRVLNLGRCLTEGWKHYVATVGATIFAHNLLVLVRC